MSLAIKSNNGLLECGTGKSQKKISTPGVSLAYFRLKPLSEPSKGLDCVPEPVGSGCPGDRGNYSLHNLSGPDLLLCGIYETSLFHNEALERVTPLGEKACMNKYLMLLFFQKKSAFIKFYFIINHRMIIHGGGKYHSKKFTSSRSNLKHQRQHTKEAVTRGKYTSTFSLLVKCDDVPALSSK